VTVPSVPLMSTLPRPTLNLDFAKSWTYPPRLSFARSGTATYRDALGDTKTAQANSPRVGVHPSNNNLRNGLVLTTGETASYSSFSEVSKLGEGTILWVGTLESIAVTSILWGINNGASTDFIRMRIDSATLGRLRLSATVGSVAQFTSDVRNPIAVDTRYAIATAWSGLQMQTVINDNEQITSTLLSTIPAMSVLSIGSVVTGLSGAVMQGVVERLRYWPTALNLQQLRAITRL